MLNQGTYQQASLDWSWAFEPVDDLWPEESVESDLEDKDGVQEQQQAARTQPWPQLPRPEWGRTMPRTNQEALQQLYTKLEQSKDQLCFIRYQEEGATVPWWYLVQVYLEETDPVAAKDRGMYHCK